MRVLSAIVLPVTGFLLVAVSDFTRRRAIRSQSIRLNFMSRAMQLQRFLEELQCGFPVARLRHEALGHCALVVDGSPQIMLLAVDLHENLVEVPPPIARPRPRNATFPEFRGEYRPEPVLPESCRFVADVMPRSCRRSSTLRSNNGKRTYTIIAKPMISGLVLK